MRSELLYGRLRGGYVYLGRYISSVRPFMKPCVICTDICLYFSIGLQEYVQEG